MTVVCSSYGVGMVVRRPWSNLEQFEKEKKRLENELENMGMGPGRE